MHSEFSVPADDAVTQPPDPSDAERPVAWSVPRAARRLDIGAMTLYRAIKDGEIAAIRVRGRLSIPDSEIQRLLTEAEQRRVALPSTTAEAGWSA